MSEQHYRSELDLVYQDDTEVAACRSTPTAHRDINAEFIARACNAYGPLVAFARLFVNDSQFGQKAEQLLKDIGEDTP